MDTPHFIIEPCHICPLPGYLVVSSREDVRFLDQLSSATLISLGGVLGVAAAAVREVMHPFRVYSGHFAERERCVHFHIFPRDESIASEYFAHNPGATSIDGPKLLSWARATFREPRDEASLHTTNARIFRAIELRLHSEGGERIDEPDAQTNAVRPGSGGQ